MSFDKDEYWKNKKDNVGSKRPKPIIVETGDIKNYVHVGSKLVPCNRSFSRRKNVDHRKVSKTTQPNDNSDAIRNKINRKELGEQQRIAKKKEELKNANS